MNRTLAYLTALVVLGCGSSPSEPSQVYSSYGLATVDGQSLPVPYSDDGSLLVRGSLGFDVLQRPRGSDPEAGTVTYALTIRRLDQSEERSTSVLLYSVRAGMLRIDLCPPLALCITTTELIGPILGPTSDLILTHHVGGIPGSVYRFFPHLPD